MSSVDDSSFHSYQMQQWLQRWKTGDKAAADELLRKIGQRLENLARRMLRSFPRIRFHTETADICQAAAWRLLKSLQRLEPITVREFFLIAATQIRRELLDLARSIRRTPLAAIGYSFEENSDCDPLEAIAANPEELEIWSRFHEAVEQLSVKEREVFSLTFYHGWTQSEIAALLEIDERTVRRRWQSACLHLNRLVGGQLPSL